MSFYKQHPIPKTLSLLTRICVPYVLQCSYVPPCERDNQKNKDNVLLWEDYFTKEVSSQSFTCFFNQQRRWDTNTHLSISRCETDKLEAGGRVRAWKLPRWQIDVTSGDYRGCFWWKIIHFLNHWDFSPWPPLPVYVSRQKWRLKFETETQVTKIRKKINLNS